MTSPGRRSRLGTLAGGLVGLAAALLLLFNGRVAGISGIVGGLLRPMRGDIAWRAAFVAGPRRRAAGLARRRRHAPRSTCRRHRPCWCAAGLLVGWGTRYGSGCTSGHGVCGLSRGSLRSLAATATFMAAGFAVVFVMRHVLGT